MKALSITTSLIALGVLFKLLTDRLSADAVGMAIGLLFGMLAGLPTVLLLLVALRQQGQGGRVAYYHEPDDVYLGMTARRALPPPAGAVVDYQPELVHTAMPFPAAGLVRKEGAR